MQNQNKTKKIGWESWTDREEDFVKKHTDVDDGEDVSDEFGSTERPMILKTGNAPNLYTPFGTYEIDCLLKPSDRWDCWIGNTNFPITSNHAHVLNNDIEGIAALSIMDGYTFCVGIGKMYEFSKIREEIEQKLYEV